MKIHKNCDCTMKLMLAGTEILYKVQYTVKYIMCTRPKHTKKPYISVITKYILNRSNATDKEDAIRRFNTGKTNTWTPIKNRKYES